MTLNSLEAVLAELNNRKEVIRATYDKQMEERLWGLDEVDLAIALVTRLLTNESTL